LPLIDAGKGGGEKRKRTAPIVICSLRATPKHERRVIGTVEKFHTSFPSQNMLSVNVTELLGALVLAFC
jgi:hypothetical protein